MTRRGQIVCVLAILGGAVGTLRTQYSLLMLSLSLLIALFMAWIWFEIRLAWVWRRIHFTRRLGSNVGTKTLWSNRNFEVSLEVVCPTSLLAVVRDLVPPSVSILEGEQHALILGSGDSPRICYEAECSSPGTVNFFGLHFSFMDRCGLFASQRSFEAPQRLRVLPSFHTAADRQSIKKRLNAIPQHGIHTLKASGMGAELLELKEYQPGDPPKSIAWKVSARRGQLMTRQYESEVPVRVTLLLDDSGVMRYREAYTQPSALDQVCSLAASLAKQSIAVGDPVGLTCLTKSQVARQRPRAGERGLYTILGLLAEYAGKSTGGQLTMEDFRYAVELCHERYPQLLEPRLNGFPFSIFPIFPSARRQLKQRRQLATVISEGRKNSPTEFLELVHNPACLLQATQGWLREQGLPLHDPKGAQPVSDEQAENNFSRLSQELSKVLSLAKDNEVFVLAADIMQIQRHRQFDLQRIESEPSEPELPTELDTLLATVKVALARHHRVVFLCPTAQPNSLAALGEPAASAPRTLRKRKGRKNKAAELKEVASDVQSLILRKSMRDIQRKLRGIGAAISFVEQTDVLDHILSEIDFVRGGRLSSQRRSG